MQLATVSLYHDISQLEGPTYFCLCFTSWCGKGLKRSSVPPSFFSSTIFSWLGFNQRVQSRWQGVAWTTALVSLQLWQGLRICSQSPCEHHPRWRSLRHTREIIKWGLCSGGTKEVAKANSTIPYLQQFHKEIVLFLRNISSAIA